MDIATVLYNLIVYPIELIVEVVFSTINGLCRNPGIAILGVSFVVSILVLPLYTQADAIQDEERKKQEKLSYWVGHIKKTFKGDERFMMLSAYYRKENYHPLYSLRSSISLLLQVPFFIAAYHFLSNLELLNGKSFWLIRDLGKPDGLLTVGAFTINVLPVLMTLINYCASYIYTRGFPLKDKLQPYILALIFLVLLYGSPSGLVLY
ncbi:MAG: YidC/Oxa1 family membrane protein insertase [Lachnospiraceae bacterium]|nr:YidC/Oxa1 family membrane protein insertase [Lachnospiraceae bacterium]